MTRKIRFPGNRGAAAGVLAALASVLLCAPLSAAVDPFAFMPAKEAQKAREALSSLDASVAAWKDVSERFAAAAEDARGNVETRRDSERFKTLLASAVDGSWKGRKGLSISAALVGVRKSAERLSALLKPYVDKSEPKALEGLLTVLLERGGTLPGHVEDCLILAERVARVDSASCRFAVRALLGVVPDEVSLRLVPEGRDLDSLPYGKNTELRPLAEKIQSLRRASGAVRTAAEALAVPELAWTPEETRRAEEASRLLAVLEPRACTEALGGAALPGIDLLPAFLSGLSPEERLRWRLERGLSSRAVRVFLAVRSGSPGTALVVDADAAQRSLARVLAGLERDSARGLSGMDFLSRMTDPALRSALRQDSAPVGLRTAYDEAVDALAAALETGLSPAEAAARGTGPMEGKYRVETERPQSPGGFFLIRAFFVSAEGEQRPVSTGIVESVLESVLPDPVPAAVSGGSPRAVRLGFLVSANDAESAVSLFPSKRIEDTDPSTFAALVSESSRRLEEVALGAGVSPAHVYPFGLVELAYVCDLRCQGRARDEDVARAVEKAGGFLKASTMWSDAFRRIEATRRALNAYARKGTEP